MYDMPWWCKSKYPPRWKAASLNKVPFGWLFGYLISFLFKSFGSPRFFFVALALLLFCRFKAMLFIFCSLSLVVVCCFSNIKFKEKIFCNWQLFFACVSPFFLFIQICMYTWKGYSVRESVCLFAIFFLSVARYEFYYSVCSILQNFVAEEQLTSQ